MVSPFPVVIVKYIIAGNGFAAVGELYTIAVLSPKMISSVSFLTRAELIGVKLGFGLKIPHRLRRFDAITYYLKFLEIACEIDILDNYLVKQVYMRRLLIPLYQFFKLLLGFRAAPIPPVYAAACIFLRR